MTSRITKLSYSCVVFYSFSISFIVLGCINTFCPISNFKMTVLSVVAMLFSLQQYCEAKEDIDSKITEMEQKTKYQADVLSLIDASVEVYPKSEEGNNNSAVRSHWIFGIALILLIVGLTVDIDFKTNIISNTSTILSFALIFFTMGYKETYNTRIQELNKALHDTDARLIDSLKKQIESMKNI